MRVGRRSSCSGSPVAIPSSIHAWLRFRPSRCTSLPSVGLAITDGSSHSAPPSSGSPAWTCATCQQRRWGRRQSKPVQSTALSVSHTSDWLKGHLIAIKHLGHTLLASSVLMCLLGWCNTGLGFVMYSPSACAWHNLNRYCIILMCILKHLKPAKCVQNITYTSLWTWRHTLKSKSENNIGVHALGTSKTV